MEIRSKCTELIGDIGNFFFYNQYRWHQSIKTIKMNLTSMKESDLKENRIGNQFIEIKMSLKSEIIANGQ